MRSSSTLLTLPLLLVLYEWVFEKERLRADDSPPKVAHGNDNLLELQLKIELHTSSRLRRDGPSEERGTDNAHIRDVIFMIQCIEGN